MVSLEHKPAPVIQGNKLGSATTYIEVDTTNNAIIFVVNSVEVDRLQ